jgi:hypothetical protein
MNPIPHLNNLTGSSSPIKKFTRKAKDSKVFTFDEVN